MKIINNLCQMGYNGVLIETPLSGNCREVIVPENTQYKAEILHMSGNISLKVILVGDHAKCEINIVYLCNKISKNNINIEVIHQHKNTVSNQIIKGILTDQAQMTFDGIIRIPRDSQKCDGNQNHRAILLSDSATVKATPELEIYADDVKCAHGSAVGPLDERSLFYLMARGIPADQGRRLLIKAFLANMMPDIWEQHIDEWMNQNV